MFLEAKKLYFSPALNVSVVQKCPQPESAVHGSLLAPCFLLACWKYVTVFMSTRESLVLSLWKSARFGVECVTPVYLCFCSSLPYFHPPYSLGRSHTARCPITYTYFLIKAVCTTSLPPSFSLSLAFFLSLPPSLSRSLSPCLPAYFSVSLIQRIRWCGQCCLTLHRELHHWL